MSTGDPSRGAARAQFAREVGRSVVTQRVGSLLTIVVIALMCVMLIVTLGRSEGTRSAVIRAIEDEGSRSIIVRADADAGITTAVVARIEAVAEIQAVHAFGPSADARNAAFQRGPAISLRTWYTAPPNDTPYPGSATVSPEAAEALGLATAAGRLRTSDGRTVAIGAIRRLPAEAGFLDPVALLPEPPAAEAPVSLLIVVADQAGDVPAVVSTLQMFLPAADRGKVSIETNRELAQVQGEISTELSSATQGLVISLTLLCGILLSAILIGVVMARRKDFGRRRALGATRGFVMALVICQTVTAALVGTAIGDIGALLALHLGGNPAPPAGFVLAVSTLAVCLAVCAAVAPAYVAARRDPIRELRVA